MMKIYSFSVGKNHELKAHTPTMHCLIPTVALFLLEFAFLTRGFNIDDADHTISYTAPEGKVYPHVDAPYFDNTQTFDGTM